MKWKAYRFGYEWDFVYQEPRLRRPDPGREIHRHQRDAHRRDGRRRAQFTHAQAPIPPSASSAAATSSPTSRSPASSARSSCPSEALSSDDYSAGYYDFDLYGTVNFTDHFGAQAGLPLVRRVLQSEEGHRHAASMTASYFGGLRPSVHRGASHLGLRPARSARRAEARPGIACPCCDPSIRRSEARRRTGCGCSAAAVAGSTGTSMRAFLAGPAARSRRATSDSSSHAVVARRRCCSISVTAPLRG